MSLSSKQHFLVHETGPRKIEVGVTKMPRPPLTYLLGQLGQPNVYTRLLVITTIIIHNKIKIGPVQ